MLQARPDVQLTSCVFGKQLGHGFPGLRIAFALEILDCMRDDPVRGRAPRLECPTHGGVGADHAHAGLRIGTPARAPQACERDAKPFLMD
jgi:hypothetical protein